MTFFIEMLFAMVLGVCVGIVTGLAPGIHVNLVVTVLIAISGKMLDYTTHLVLGIFIIALSVTHIFLEFLPSVFLGAPNVDTALSVLPGHRYLLAGNGLMAVKLSVLGCFFGLLFGIFLLYPLVFVLPLVYPYIRKYMIFFLFLIFLAMILQNTRKIWALIVFLLSGITGYIVLNMPNLEDPLFPLLTGLFGTATLLLGLYEKNTIPQQHETDAIAVDKKSCSKAVIAGQCSALLLALFPGISPAIAALFGMQIAKNNGDHGYMILQGCINSAGFLFSIATLYAISKARNGAVVGIEQLTGTLTLSEMFLFGVAAVVVGAIASILTIKIGKMFCRFVENINYQKLTIGILCLLVLLTIGLSGWRGVLILITTTAIGIIPGIVKVTRTQAMGCLLLPTMMYYL